KAMENSRSLIAAYVEAGYQKIHLDTSMFCADDQGNRHEPLADDIVAARSAELCQVAEETWKANFKGPSQLVYIIGTEVPIPGGIQDPEEGVIPTSADDARTTIEVTRAAFENRGLADAWKRVVGVVVQPGVEYGDDMIFPFNSDSAQNLSQTITEYENIVFEAHSTDYQSESALTELVRDHFCILKVGPWLTYAYREALFALESIEQELVEAGYDFKPSRLREILETVMNENPGYWKKYYSGNTQDLRLKRKFSLSDRSRYYWPEERLHTAVATLVKNLSAHKIPATLISQYLPGSFDAVLAGTLNASPEALLKDKIREVLGKYSRACKA
ncbi:MAG: class II D-tagatose-bisphosphate aldolase, non-catalytic subunit, partial [Spirochaetaceae bacterium]|nr:class II D-tagatose-bisphosphate aldolase, non-catalytic subunit [Spirochaetaceae bacterium]